VTRRTDPSSRTPLTRHRALAAAVALADAEGLGALTMRRLARTLDVEAMSLYHHVSNKEDILDGMVDLVYGEIDTPSPGEAWRPALRRRAYSMRSALVRHPWAISLMESRRSPGPANLRHHDHLLGCLRAAGFSLTMTSHAAALVDAYTYGFAHEEITLPFDSPAETRELASGLIAALPADEYPYLAEFTNEYVMLPGYDYAAEFDFGLELILDGLERAVAAESPGKRAATAADGMV
jgi:AcrR family transcriptional regulator